MRTLRTAATLSLALTAVGFSVIAFAKEPTTAPSDAQATTQPASPLAKARVAAAMKLFQPYSLVTDLTDDQRSQIAAIRAEMNEKRHALDADEESRCMAVLTDAQKSALNEAIDKKKADAKAAKGTPTAK